MCVIATKIQFDAFKMMFDEENTRYIELTNRAKIILPIISLVLGAVFFQLDLALEVTQQHWISKTLLVGIWLCFLGSMTCTLASLLVPSYEWLFDPSEVAGELDELEVGEEVAERGEAGASEDNVVEDGYGVEDNSEVDSEFLANRIVDFVVVIERNSQRNDTRALWLNIAVGSMTGGFMLTFALMMMKILG